MLRSHFNIFRLCAKFIFRLPILCSILYFLQNFDRPIGVQVINKFLERKNSDKQLSILTRAESRVILNLKKDGKVTNAHVDCAGLSLALVFCVSTY